ncbi:hypothetical protein [Glutamicibacter protophormiae]|uniref:hypothetical protein n=1 Tax=Glutamicibacter protophormiae TaxID=37930 RepID=UPI00331AFBBF
MTALTLTEQLIKSRERVRAHGEVFTPKSMVNQMLDLVKPELETGPNFVDKTFFEPAAGDGNFLVAIFQRKLHAIEKRYQPSVWPAETLFALASIYGIELLKDNHRSAQESLLGIFVDFHQRTGTSCGPRTNLYRAAVKLVETNVLNGNTLTGLTAGGDEIQFSWWHRLLNEPGMVRREPFSLSSLRNSSVGTGMFDFAIYESYEVCRIEHVYKEVKG